MIGAIVLAAGLSTRMGRPKMALPWGKTTVIEHVVGVLHQAGIEEIIVVTGGARQQVEAALKNSPARPIFNPRHAQDHMLLSLQVGLRYLSENSQMAEGSEAARGSEAAMIALGDQPQIQESVVRALLQAYQASRSPLVIPSYQMRRGHPWVVARPLWGEILALQPPATLRTVIDSHANQIDYLVVETDSILRDLDTPGDYQRECPDKHKNA